MPDVVANMKATINNWYRYVGDVRAYGWPVAFAAQDGMTPENVPLDADLVFIGGTTAWKWNALPTFARAFKRVHVGRVNSLEKIYRCEDFGVESCDGSGWFRDTAGGRRGRHLLWWLQGLRDPARQMPLITEPFSPVP